MPKTFLPLAPLAPLAALAFLSSLGSSPSPARAQVIFEPVQYQFGPSPTFYYGGADLRVIAFAARTASADAIAGPRGGGDTHAVRFAVGNSYRGSIGGRPPRVFSDRIPYCDAALFGYTAADVRNDANAAVPTYFRKADLLESAVPADGGTVRVVPARAPLPPAASIDIRPYPRPAGPRPATNPTTGPAAPATQPADGPRPLLILPKSLLQPPAAPAAPAPSAATVRQVVETK